MFNGHRDFLIHIEKHKLNYVHHKVCVTVKVCLCKCCVKRLLSRVCVCVCVCVERASRREMFLICVWADTLLRWRTDSLEFFTWATSWEHTDRKRGKIERKNKSTYWVNGENVCQLKQGCVFVEDAEHASWMSNTGQVIKMALKDKCPERIVN